MGPPLLLKRSIELAGLIRVISHMSILWQWIANVMTSFFIHYHLSLRIPTSYPAHFNRHLITLLDKGNWIIWYGQCFSFFKFYWPLMDSAFGFFWWSREKSLNQSPCTYQDMKWLSPSRKDSHVHGQLPLQGDRFFCIDEVLYWYLVKPRAIVYDDLTYHVLKNTKRNQL